MKSRFLFQATIASRRLCLSIEDELRINPERPIKLTVIVPPRSEVESSPVITGYSVD